MSYTDAEEHAKKAAAAAKASKAHYDEHSDRKLAEAVSELALAVQELAAQIRRDS